MNKTLRFLNHDVLGPAGPFRERESLCMNVASSMLALLVALDFYKLYILASSQKKSQTRKMAM